MSGEVAQVTFRRLAGTFALNAAVVGLAAWIGTGEVIWIGAAAPAAALGLLLERSSGAVRVCSGALLLLGVLAAFESERELGRLAAEWTERSAAWEGRIQDRLATELDELLQEGESVVDRLAERWSSGLLDGPGLPGDLRSSAVDALALFGPSGELLAWEGAHQGPLPEEVRRGSARYLFREGALFRYLYVTAPVPSGLGTAVAGFLLRSELPPLLSPPANDFESRFESSTGASIEITRADRALGESIWDLRWDGESLFSVTLLPPSEANERADRELLWGRMVALLLAGGWLLAVFGARGNPLGGGLGVVSLLFTLLLLPLGRLTGGGQLLSPADFLLPGPVPLTFGALVAFGAAGALGAGLLPWERLPRIPLPVVAALAALLAGGALFALERGASGGFLAGSELAWVLFQGTAAAFVTFAFSAALLGRAADDDRSQPYLLLGAAVLAVVLALGWSWLAHHSLTTPRWLVFLWIVPLVGIVRGLPEGPRWTKALLRWGALAALAVSVVLPWAWSLRVEARIAAAEDRLDRLGTRADPFLEFLLLRAAEEARDLAEAGRDPVEVLYGTWTASGLAWEGVPLWITFWSSGGVSQEELRIGVSDPRPALPAGFLESARVGDEVVIRRFDLADAHYLGVAPLPRGAAVSIVIPPRRALEGASPLGPLFSPARAQADPLVLVPILPGEAPGATEGIEWISTEQGWQGETFLAYPDEAYHAHYIVELPGWMLRIARGTLLLFLNLAVLALVWTLGRWVGEGSLGRIGPAFGALSSFRGRVTLALFAFFLVPTVLFGTLAYRTLAGASGRTAEALAVRAAEDATSWYAEVGGAMDVLARRVGSDLLLYENGELASGSLPELVRLGLYEGWLPPEIHAQLARGEDVMTIAPSSLGGLDYVVAYRRMPGGRVLAAPAPLEAGATALRQRDVTDLIGLAVLLGGLLSVLLSLRVGRALARPIQTLQIASERVGAGNMNVHLPERPGDEFGSVFGAFNRMVDRLAQTRRALLRTSRRTRAIVEEVATGVVALNRQGRVTLVNPRAEELLGVTLELGTLLPRGEGAGGRVGALAQWVESYFRDGLREAGTELSIGARRIRVRARRISRRGPLGGAVISLEDVTDELRTERILAWGEMAQQVAHEVKNPLTPIKLGVQHIRRAWEGKEADFPQILDRNVNAILGEIDRLASVATSFSRFAAPSPAGEAPLDSVRVTGVVGEVLDLYRAGGGPVTFEFRGGESVPAVRAREGELKEVLVNLLENARAALPGGGRVEVEAEEKGNEIELRVRDTGTGIPPELMPRIFEPHFSTRATGSGLGLAIVRRLVDSWGGRVQAESEAGAGTLITLRLQRWSGTGSSGRPPDPSGGGATPPDS
ncbi:MAG: ATP-binding protein [Gemmatimonadota bacterium]